MPQKIKQTQKDESEIEIMREYYACYQRMCELSGKLKTIYGKGRKPNFPEFISEFLARTITAGAIKAKVGDLDLEEDGKTYKLEVKCFASDGPISFGPTEKWDRICLLDARKHGWITAHFHNIANTDSVWQNIRVSKKETYKAQCISGRRPRIGYKSLHAQLPTPVKTVSFKIEEILGSGKISRAKSY